jgi:DNA repair exonuclease SbcCD ATPase subunit
MIASVGARPAAFSRAAAAVPAVLVAALLAACASERETTLSRSARHREVAGLRAERDRLQREIAIVARTNAETAAALVAARERSVTSASELRTALAALRIELDRQLRGEAELAAARTRQQQIEAELAPLRALEATLREQEAARTAAAARSAALAGELEALASQVAATEAELRPRLAALQQKLAALQQAGVAIAAADAAVAAAAKVLAPPAPVAPATAPAGK